MVHRPFEDEELIHLAEAVALGSSVDWSTAETTASPETLRIIEQLKVVAQLAAVHRGPAAEAGAGCERDPPAHPVASWGPLVIRRELGRGRFGTVYLAWDPALEREVALKIMHDRGRSAVVLHEGRMLARVRHPNVVAVYGVDEYDEAVGLWMELVDGLSLKQLLATRGMLGAQEAALIGIDLCRAVAAVHKAGLLHRDIKVHNVMRETGGRIVLMDFGTGEIRSDELAPRSRAGTPLYLAPEIFDGQPATIASDIYSIGVLLFHLVTLQYPVGGDTLDAIEAGHSERRPVHLSDIRPDVPPAFAHVVERALDRDPARRYRSAGAMQQELADALARNFAPRAVGASAAVPAAVAIPSIAVLPFMNLGPDQDIEYFCDGLAEELLIGLGKVEGLKVASRTSSRALQGTSDVRTLCRQLNVTALLEGTVRKSGDRLRITAQLVSADDGCHLWSEGYNRDMADVLSVQEGIAQNVVDRLKTTLSELGTRPVTRRHTDNPRAYHYYLKGRFYWSRRYRAGLRSALEQFQKAIEEDAGYALAYAGVADAYTFMGFYSLQLPREAFARAAAAVDRALSLDPALPEAYASLALVKFAGDWDWAAAERAFRRALELDPTQVFSRIYLSWLLVLVGDVPAAIMEARRAQEIEPLLPLLTAGVGHTFFLARRYEEAVAECEKSLEVDPTLVLPVHFMAMSRAQQGQLDEAIRLMERCVAASDRAPFYLGLLGNFCARAGHREKVDAILAELERASAHQYVPPHCMTYIYAALNELDRAVEWEAKAYEEGASPFNYFSPVIENLHAHPGHIAEVNRMKMRAHRDDRT